MINLILFAPDFFCDLLKDSEHLLLFLVQEALKIIARPGYACWFNEKRLAAVGLVANDSGNIVPEPNFDRDHKPALTDGDGAALQIPSNTR